MLFPVIAKRGSTGSKVKKIQDDLNLWALVEGHHLGRSKDTLVPDGDFGELTEAAVKLYQKSQGLLDDGVVGPFTSAMLLRKEFVVKAPFSATPVAQNNRIKCWAAATEYWLKTRPSFKQTQEEIIRELRELGDSLGISAISPRGGLTIPAGQKLWEHFFKIRPIAKFASEFFAEHVATNLKRSGGPLILGRIEFDPKSGHLGIGHVVCPIIVQVGPIGKDGTHMLGITVMDPLGDGRFVTFDIRDLQKRDDPKKSTIMLTWVDFGIIPF